jgi:hypothetical protein
VRPDAPKTAIVASRAVAVVAALWGETNAVAVPRRADEIVRTERIFMICWPVIIEIFYEQRLSRIEDGRIAPTAAVDSGFRDLCASVNA